MALFDLTVIDEDPSLHGIEDNAIVQIGTARCIPYLDMNCDITPYGG